MSECKHDQIGWALPDHAVEGPAAHEHDGANGEPLCDSARSAWQMVGEHDGQIARLEAQLAEIRELVGGLDHESTVDAVRDVANEHEHFSKEMHKAGYETIPRLEAALQAAEDRADRAEAALPDPAKLWALADWIDSKYPNDSDPEVQNDLRAWARGIMALKLQAHRGIRVPAVCEIDHEAPAAPSAQGLEGMR